MVRSCRQYLTCSLCPHLRIPAPRTPAFPPDMRPSVMSAFDADAAWAGGRVVECTGLENRRTLTGLVGSNPTLPVELQRPGASDAMEALCVWEDCGGCGSFTRAST